MPLPVLLLGFFPRVADGEAAGAGLEGGGGGGLLHLVLTAGDEAGRTEAEEVARVGVSIASSFRL